MKASKIILSNRTKENAEILKRSFKNLEVIDWGKLTNFDMIINATSVGLKKDDKINLDFSEVGNDKFFYDIIYNPAETDFLKNAKKSDNKTENGKKMFIYQASAAFKIWHGIKPVIDDQILEIFNND